MTACPRRFLVAALLLALAGGPRALFARTGPEAPREEKKPPAPPRVDLSEAIRSLAKNGEGLESFSAEVAWRREGAVTTAKVFGSGVGIWRTRAQFRLSRKQVLSIVQAMDEAGFGRMPEQFGEDLEKDQALQMAGRITVSLGDRTKRVTQLADGEQSAALEGVAKRFLEVCEAGRKEGEITAASLPDALGKLGRGELAPETLQLYVQRVVEHPGEGEGPFGWILHSTGRTLVVRERSSAKGMGTPVSFRLDPHDFEALVRALQDADPATFPGNLYAPDYTDFTVRILDQGRSLQARRFLNVTPQTHGEKQKRFDALYAAIDALHRRAMADGKVTPAAD